MAISLTKGGNVSLTKEAPGITKTTVGLGWNPRVTDGQAFDLDAIAFLVGENGKVRADTDFIFFNNLTSSDGSVKHNGDNRTGEGDGDDEQQVAADHQHVVPAEAARQPGLRLAQHATGGFGNCDQQGSQQQDQQGRGEKHHAVDPNPLGGGLYQGGRTHCTDAPGGA